MYTLERLLEDVKARGPLSKKDKGGDYQEVWDAFNRYLTAVLEKQLTLTISNFCKIGWKVEGETQGKLKLRPHFHLVESFVRAYSVDTKGLSPVADKLLTQCEEFNFSKAAIRYSQSLTKDNIFMGMRAIMQQLGEAIASGQAVAVDFEVGRLVSNERAVSFNFAAELYVQQGLEVPSGLAPDETQYKPSATFLPPSKDAMSLSLQGTVHPNSSVSAHCSFLGGGWAEDSGGGSAGANATGSAPGSSYRRQEATAGGGQDFSASPSSTLPRHEQAHNEALDRHLTKMENDAATAMAEKANWEAHLGRLQDEEQKDSSWKRALAKEHAEQLRWQMQEAEHKRAEGRQHVVEMASLHEFPSFQEAPEQSVYDYIRERRLHLKEDLDQQVDIKRRTKQYTKQQDRDLEAMHIEASKKELAMMKFEAVSKKGVENSILHEAWDKDKRIHAVKKAIEEHHKTPVTRANLPGVLNNHGLSASGTGPAPLSFGAATLGSMPSPRNSETPGSARLSTGSSRRVPFGAAASLALHKEKTRRR